MKKYHTALFIFRRDLRLDDNTGLIRSLMESDYVIPLFIFTPIQISQKNKFKSSNSIQFMVDSLYDLDQQIRDINSKCRLWTIYSNEIDAISHIYKKIGFEAIYINEDYTPYAIKRDNAIKKFCKNNRIEFIVSTDALLLGTQDIYASNGNAYRIFAQFYRKTLSRPIPQPDYNIGSNFKAAPNILKKWNIKNMDNFLLKKNFYQINDNIAVNGGRTNALEILRHANIFKNYNKYHDFLTYQTSMLSAHNKFGTVSIREVYWAFKKKLKNSGIIKQLYWRDFYYYVAIHFYKEFFGYEHIVKKTKNKIKWVNNTKYFSAWKKGKTGFPIVDAAMAQMNQTGFMHNRGRLIVAQFLSKDLLINWKYGEQYFSKKLVDIDRIQNLGNWNWSSSFGLDATPFLRIFNPWTQSKSFDPECEYIKKWIPELSGVDPNHIHHWYKYYKNYPGIKYPSPIVEHNAQRKKYIKFYKNYFGK